MTFTEAVEDTLILVICVLAFVGACALLGYEVGLERASGIVVGNMLYRLVIKPYFARRSASA